MTEKDQIDEAKLEADLSKIQTLYEQLPIEELSKDTQNEILREAHKRGFSFTRLRAFFRRPRNTAIASLAGIGVAIFLTLTAIQRPLMVATTELPEDQIQVHVGGDVDSLFGDKSPEEIVELIKQLKAGDKNDEAEILQKLFNQKYPNYSNDGATATD